MRFVPFVVASLAAVVACRSSSNNPPTPDTPGSNGAVTIEMIQNGTVATGAQVEVDGVVVTAIDNFGHTTGNIWVEDPAGGEFSGVLVYKADPNVVATLAVGDVVNISNALTAQFALTGSNADPTGRTDTELEPLASGQTVTVVKTGTGTVPAPVAVDALTIGMGSDADAQGPTFSAAWRKYLGVLVTVTNVSAVGAPKAFGSTMPTPPDDYDMGITGVAKAESSLVAFPSGLARGSCISTMTGVVDYFYDYLVLFTPDANGNANMTIASGSGSCPAAETVCNDGIDNDGNGFADCPTASSTGDDNCIVTDATCQDGTQTIAKLDADADAAPTAPALPFLGVKLTGVCVTAVNGGSVYVQAAATAAADGGIYAFASDAVLPTGTAAGNLLDIIGTAKGFKAKASTSTDVELELDALQFTAHAGNCNPRAATGMTAATLSADSTGHPWIGSLVTLTAVTIATATTATNHFGTMTQGTTTFAFDDAIVNDTAASGTVYTSVTGVWTYDTQANAGAGGYELVLTTTPQ